MNSPKGAQILLYEMLYKQYSTLEFKNSYDRPIAIAGLEQRLIRAFGKDGGYGVFECYFGRSLLWQRDPGLNRPKDGPPLKEVKFPEQQQYRVPTWSWMAYEGGITFINLEFDTVKWEDEEQISSPWVPSHGSSSTWHSADSEGRIDLTGMARDLDLALADENIVYDKVVRPSGRTIKCVVIASQKPEVSHDVATRRHYVLVIALKHVVGDDNIYERVGVGSLLGSWIALDQPGLKVRIF
jgi:hypothetical protein